MDEENVKNKSFKKNLSYEVLEKKLVLETLKDLDDACC